MSQTWRGFFQRKKIGQTRHDELQFIGMVYIPHTYPTATHACYLTYMHVYACINYTVCWYYMHIIIVDTGSCSTNSFATKAWAYTNF